MSDSDLPDLVESSDDDSGDNDEAQKGLVYADTWLKKGGKYLEKQELWMRVFSLAPFLFGVNNIISVAWNKALMNAKLLWKERRTNETTFLEWPEWECLDLVDHVVTVVQLYFRDRNHLAKSLDCAERLDDCKDGVVIDVDSAINEAHKVTEISNLWRNVLKHEVSSGKEKAAKFAVLYVIRIYREHVIFLCDKSKDFIDHIRKLNMGSASQSHKIAEEHKKKGNEFFKSENFENAVNNYSLAAKEDPFSHVYYGNRAQAYLSLKKYRDALADGRRAIIIKPDFPKGHYRYAVAFHGLGQLDSAIRVNERGLELCQKSSNQDFQNIKELETQGYNFYQERANNSSVLTSIPKDLGDQLASIPSPHTDITEKLGCTVPLKTRKIDDEHQGRGSSETDSDAPNSHDHKKVKRKKKSKAKNSSTKDISAKTEKGKEQSEDMVIPQEKRNGQYSEKSEQQQIEEFKTYLSDAFDSFMRQANKKAMTSYQKALELVSLSDHLKVFGMDDSDLLTLKYAFSISAIGTNNYKNIMDGIEKLEEIKDYCETHDDIKFPVLYYGLGKAYVSLNRFPEAMDPLQDGYQVASSVTYPQVTWPGTKQLIKETDPTVLQESLKHLLQLCKFPPPPDSVCRNHTDLTDKRTVIYLTDPDFKGYIKIICQMSCVITFHQVCFKSYKNSLNKQSDRDVLDTLCPTPDCVGYIIKVHVVRSDSLSKEYLSEKYVDFKDNNKNRKPVAKQKTTNESKIAKKQDKKDKRKQKKKEYTDQEPLTNNKQDDSDEVITDGASAMAFIADIENEVQALPDVKDTTVLRKDAVDIQKPGKGRKNKKKTKDKSKQILNVEVNFSDRREETLLNENSVLSDEEKENVKNAEPIQNPFSVPSELKSQIKNFEKTYTGPPKTALLSKPDEVTENLFLYFVEILKANGPLAIDDTRVQQELEVFPQEALEKIKLVGGLADFLRQSLKFAVIDDVISLMSDAVRAREIALIRRQERQTSGNEPAVQSAWKTVGKSVNNVDALSESIKTNVTTVASISTSSSLNFSDVNSSVITKTSSVLPNSNNSNSVSPFGNLHASSPPQTSQGKHWSEGVSSFDITNPIKPPAPVLAPVTVQTFDTLDSIDDLPIQDTSELKTKKDLDDIDDLDRISESGSEFKESQESGGYKNGFRLDPRFASLEIGKVDSNSRCSSKSDISEKSYGSAFGNIGQPKVAQTWDKLESDFDSSWSRGSRDENQSVDRHNVESVALEAKRLGEEFVRKSDETFVSELAESVVEKLYEGKMVSDVERTSTLDQVSADIWKDFERSANAGKKGVSSLWANTPAGADYSKNMGKFATDFMKRHYNPERKLVSPTLNLNTLPSQKPSVTPDSFSSFSNHPGFNSSYPWPDGKAITDMQVQHSVSSSSGYNLFSGPTWGLDSFNSSSTQSAPSPLSVPPPKPMMPPPPQGPFVRPPLAVSGYYQNPNIQVPFRPPPRLSMPPPMGIPFPPHIRVERKDKEIQASAQVETTGTMTEVYEPFKKEYLQMKENRNEAIRVMAESKNLYEKLLLEHKAKEQQIVVLEADINNKVGMFDLEKKSWKNEREAFVDEIRRLQEQASSRDSLEKELKEKMIGQEKRVNDLAILAKDQRDKDLAEIKKCMENAEKFRHLHDTQLQRAVSSETEILKSKLQAAKSALERSQKEAGFHKQRLSSFVQKHEDDNKPVPPPLQQALEFMTSAVKKSDENLDSVIAAYEEQMAKIKAGTPLADLEPIAVPSPPPVPESIRGLPFMQPGMPGFMMPRMQFPNRPPFNNPGMVKVQSPVGSSPAAIGAPISVVPSKPTDTVQQPVQAQVQSSSGNNTGLAAGATQSHYNTSLPVSMQVTPRPLVTPSAGAGLTKPGPLPPRAPLAVPNRAPLRPIGIGGVAAQMSSFDKLVVKLKMTFPEKSRTELSQLIHGLRQKRGGSLSGMTMEDIIQQIAELITAQEQQANTGILEQTDIQQATAGSTTVGPPPGLNTSWAFLAGGGSKLGPGKGSGSELYREEEEDPCVICHEEMDPKSIVTLECGHLFHDECIRKWFQEQSTCPNCRVHTLLSDEFPSLG